jgi:hypothetical protein
VGDSIDEQPKHTIALTGDWSSEVAGLVGPVASRSGQGVVLNGAEDLPGLQHDGRVRWEEVGHSRTGPCQPRQCVRASPHCSDECLTGPMTVVPGDLGNGVGDACLPDQHVSECAEWQDAFA